jgi:hypothetical protein
MVPLGFRTTVLYCLSSLTGPCLLHCRKAVSTLEASSYLIERTGQRLSHTCYGSHDRISARQSTRLPRLPARPRSSRPNTAAPRLLVPPPFVLLRARFAFVERTCRRLPRAGAHGRPGLATFVVHTRAMPKLKTSSTNENSPPPI